MNRHEKEQMRELARDLREAQTLIDELEDEIAELQEESDTDSEALTELALDVQRLDTQLADQEDVAVTRRDHIASTVHDFLRARGNTEDVPWGCATAAWRSDLARLLEDVL